MIFLSLTLAIKPSTDLLELISSFTSMRACLTLSREVFLDHIQRSFSAAAHVAIIEIDNPADTGNEVGAFHQSLSERLRVGHFPAGADQGRLAFFDWKILRLFRGKELASVDIERFELHFAGCLAWETASGSATSARQRTCELKAIWKWRGLMNSFL